MSILAVLPPAAAPWLGIVVARHLATWLGAGSPIRMQYITAFNSVEQHWIRQHTKKGMDGHRGGIAVRGEETS